MFLFPPFFIRPAEAMKLSSHDLQKLDEDALRRLPEAALRHLSLTLLGDLKEARERLAQNLRNSSRPPSSRPPWEHDPPADPPGPADQPALGAPAPPADAPPADHPTTTPSPPATSPTGVPRDSQAESAGRASRWGPSGSDEPSSSPPIPPKTTAPRSVPAVVSP